MDHFIICFLICKFEQYLMQVSLFHLFFFPPRTTRSMRAFTSGLFAYSIHFPTYAIFLRILQTLLDSKNFVCAAENTPKNKTFEKIILNSV